MNFSIVPKGNKSLRLDTLRLVNFRCFDEFPISFHESLTVIVGGNGQGKTATLDAIAAALGPFVGGFDDGKDCYFERDDIRLIRATGSNRMEVADGGIKLYAKGLIDYHELPWNRELAGPKSRTTRKGAQLLTQFAKKLQSQVRKEVEGDLTGTCLPVVAYYGTDRLWNIRRLPYKPLPRTSRMVGYTHCLESGSDFHLMAEWFRYWSYASLERRHKAQQEGKLFEPSEADNALEAVRNAINLCLKPSGWSDIDFSIERQEIVARHPQQGELPVGMLSDGIRSMLTLVADIAFRAVKLNPNLGPFAATNTDGIVLIDEVDMHLHPAWQQTVLSSLCEAFPRIQFIVTTHSPQVLTSVDSSSIRAIQEESDPDRGNARFIVKSGFAQTKGVASSDLLSDIMGVGPIPEIPEAQMVSDYHALIQQNLHEGSDGLALRNKMIDHFGEDHPVVRECDRMIRLQGFKQKLPIPVGQG